MIFITPPAAMATTTGALVYSAAAGLPAAHTPSAAPGHTPSAAPDLPSTQLPLGEIGLSLALSALVQARERRKKSHGDSDLCGCASGPGRRYHPVGILLLVPREPLSDEAHWNALERPTHARPFKPRGFPGDLYEAAWGFVAEGEQPFPHVPHTSGLKVLVRVASSNFSWVSQHRTDP